MLAGVRIAEARYDGDVDNGGDIYEVCIKWENGSRLWEELQYNGAAGS